MKSPGGTQPAPQPLVAVVDDDQSVRESLPDLLKELGFEAVAFSSAEDFLHSESNTKANCLVLDIAMPGMSGPELQAELKRRGQEKPIVFITGHKDDLTRKRLMDSGAIDVLQKPFSDVALRQALTKAMS
jgi:FixJ family two-component response regulator